MVVTGVHCATLKPIFWLKMHNYLAGAAEAVGSAEKRVETGERIHTSLSFVRRIIFRRIENDNLCTCAEGLISL